jgi:hypothetical protein
MMIRMSVPYFKSTALGAVPRMRPLLDDEHVLAFVEAVNGTYLHAVHVFTFNIAFIDDVGHHLLRVVGTPVPAPSFKKIAVVN